MSSTAAAHRHWKEDFRREVVVGQRRLAGDVCVPAGTSALVVFAHGSGSSRLSPRNAAVAKALNQKGIATLLFDLLSADEELDRTNVFDIPLLAERLVDVVGWIGDQRELAGLRLGGDVATQRCGFVCLAEEEPMKVRLKITKEGISLYTSDYEIDDAHTFGQACSDVWQQLQRVRLNRETSVGALMEHVNDSVLEQLDGSTITITLA